MNVVLLQISHFHFDTKYKYWITSNISLHITISFSILRGGFSLDEGGLLANELPGVERRRDAAVAVDGGELGRLLAQVLQSFDVLEDKQGLHGVRRGRLGGEHSCCGLRVLLVVRSQSGLGLSYELGGEVPL